MTKTEYRKYIQGEDWQKRRKEFLRDLMVCSNCEMSRGISIIAYDQDLHVHHVSYANLGAETLRDLKALCARCHEIETFGHSALHEVRLQKCSLCGESKIEPFDPMCASCSAYWDGPPYHWIQQYWEKYLRQTAWVIGVNKAIDTLAQYGADIKTRGYDPGKDCAENVSNEFERTTKDG